jgi:hypothetical protein
LLQAWRQLLEATEVAESNPLFMKCGEVFDYFLFGEAEQALDLILGAVPVFRGEGVNGYVFYLAVVEVSNHRAQVFCPCPVTLKSG